MVPLNIRIKKVDKLNHMVAKVVGEVVEYKNPLKALVGAFSVITNLRMDLRFNL